MLLGVLGEGGLGLGLRWGRRAGEETACVVEDFVVGEGGCGGGGCVWGCGSRGLVFFFDAVVGSVGAGGGAAATGARGGGEGRGGEGVG